MWLFKLCGFSKVAFCGSFILVSLCLACYWNGLPGQLVHDDIFAIRDNQDIRPDTPIIQLFYNDFWGKPMSDPTSHKSYRPLTVLTFRINYAIHGLSSWGYHLTNLLLHIITTHLVWLLSSTVLFSTHTYILSLQTAVLFAVHPVHTEAVTGIVGRAELLACIFFIICFLMYHNCIVVQSTGWWFTKIMMCIISGTIAMLCKEQGITAFALCISYDGVLIMKSYFRNENKNNVSLTPTAKRVSMVVMATICLMIFRIRMLHGVLPQFSPQDNPASFSESLTTRFLTYCYLYYFNVKLLLCPSTLCYDWQMGSIPLIESVSDMRNICTLIFFLYFTFLTLSLKFNEYGWLIVIVGMSISVVSFLPASNVFIRVGFVVAERALYIPSIGTCIIVTYGFYVCSKSLSKWKFKMSAEYITNIFFVYIVVLFMLKTIHHNPVWNSREALFRSGIDTVPNNAKVHYNYANYLKDVGLSDEAIIHYRRAILLSHDHSSAHNNLATLLSGLEAEHHLKQAILYNPKHFKAYFNLANNQWNSNLENEAETNYRHSLSINPNYTDALLKLSSLLAKQGRFNESEHFISRALEINKSSPDILCNLASLLMSIGKPLTAIDVYEKALHLNPAHSQALAGLAKVYRNLQDNKKAETLYKRSLAIEQNAAVYESLAALYYNTGYIKESYDMFEKAFKLSPYSGACCGYAQVAHRLNKVEILKDLVERFPKLYCTNFHYASVLHNYYNSAYFEKSLHYVSISINIAVTDREKFDACTLKATVLKDLKRFPEAAQSYKEAVVIFPQEVSALINLGAVMHLMGNFTAAEKYYKQAQLIEPKNVLVQSNLNKLKKQKYPKAA